jgi:hypothetical protein
VFGFVGARGVMNGTLSQNPTLDDDRPFIVLTETKLRGYVTMATGLTS